MIEQPSKKSNMLVWSNWVNWMQSELWLENISQLVISYCKTGWWDSVAITKSFHFDQSLQIREHFEHVHHKMWNIPIQASIKLIFHSVFFRRPALTGTNFLVNGWCITWLLPKSMWCNILQDEKVNAVFIRQEDHLLTKRGSGWQPFSSFVTVEGVFIKARLNTCNSWSSNTSNEWDCTSRLTKI